MSKNDKETHPKEFISNSQDSPPPSPMPDQPTAPAPALPPSPAPVSPPMDKSAKKTTDIIASVCALLMVGFYVVDRYTTSMTAVVKGGQWEASQSVKTDLEAMDGKKKQVSGPDRMTVDDANNVCSMYLVCIYNKGKHTMKNPQMKLPKAIHWEVSWEDPNNGPQRKEYSARETIVLPPIECMSDMDVTVWGGLGGNQIERQEDYDYSGRPWRGAFRYKDACLGTSPVVKPAQ